MLNESRRIYATVLLACVAGYGWIAFNLIYNTPFKNAPQVCLVKRITSMPCPSCGTTRAVLAISKGDFTEAARINPFGFIVVLIMIVAPFWILWDQLRRRTTFLSIYNSVQSTLRKPIYLIPLTLLVLMNWMWNISKGL